MVAISPPTISSPTISSPTISSPKPYIPPPQQLAAPPPGSNGSIYGNSNAIAANNALAQNNLANIGKGGSRRRFKGGATIVVPPVQIPYKDPGNMTNANVSNSTMLGATLNANSQFDACVGSTNPACGQVAGGRQIKGGWPNWGCMSGGIRKRKSSKKSKSRRKCRKTRKCRRRKR
jgi:hypothetical protein